MNKDKELKVGDIVVLNSGSYHMTVCRVEEDSVVCNWFNECKKNHCTVNKNSLTKVNSQISDESNFEVGDVVALKSDGPSMTINRIEGNMIHCVWFSNEQTEFTSIPANALMKVELKDE